MARTEPSAASVGKGDLDVLVLSERLVAELIEPRALLAALADGFRALAAGEVQSPDRPQVTTPDGFLLAMAAWRPGGAVAVKNVAVFEGNVARGLPSHLATINLYDAETGRILCVMDGTHVTAVRTAGAAVLSVDVLARRDARVATVVGAGVQAREHLALLPLVRDLDEILLASLHHEHAVELAAGRERVRAVEDLEAAVRRSDVVCLATHASAPVIDPRWVRPGTHVTSIGYAPPAGELPPELARAHRLVVEDRRALAPAPVGCAELAGIEPSRATPLGDILSGAAPGRTADDEITVYKAMGLAMEDLVAAELAYRAARGRGLGATAVL